MANQNFRVKHGLEVNGNTLVTGITTIGSLDTAVADIISLSGTNISISGIASLPTLDTTFGEINYLSGVNLEYSGIASVTKLEATNAFVGVAATITTIDVTDGTIDVLSGTNINISGIATATTFSGNLTGNVTGNADTSTKLFTSRDFSISGDVATASAVSFDGSGNVDLAVSLSNNFNANTSGIITATQFHTGAEGSAIIVTSNTISGPSTITIDPSGVGDNTGLVVIKGDLQIDGTQTIVNSTVVTVDDKNLLLGSGALNDAAADGGGITLESADGNKTFNWIDSTDSWTSSENLDLASGKVYNINGVEVLSATKLTTTNVSASGIITATTFSGNLIGNVTGNVTGNLVGIASQAATLFTSRDFSLTGDVATVASGSFDGSSNLNLVTKLSNSFSANTTGIITATRFNSTQLNVTGLATINQLHLSGLTPDGSTYGIINYVPVADGNGTWSWQPIAAAGGGSLDGITLLEEGTAVGDAGSIISVNLIGNNITATATGSSATITLNDNPSFGYVNLSGIITASSFVKSGGTSSQFLKADGTVDSSTYLTSYTETQTLDDVLTLGHISSTGIQVGISTVGNQLSITSSDGTVGRLDLYCEVSNAHYTRLQAAPHSTYSGNATVVVPNTSGTLLLTDGDGSALTGIVTSISATNNISVDQSTGSITITGPDLSSYLTSYTETQTLDDVLTLGHISSTGIQVGISTVGNQLSITSSDGTVGRLDLYCEVSNLHYTRLQAAPHSTYSGNATVVVPNTSGTLLLTDGDGSSLTNIVTGITAGVGVTISGSTGNVTINATATGSALTLKEVASRTGATNTTVSNVEEIRFNNGAGFSVLDEGSGIAFVDLGSTFNPWYIDGQDTLKATGEEPIEFIAGPGIAITTKAVASVGIGTTFSKAITINAKGYVNVGSDFPSVGISTTGDTFYHTDYGKIFVYYDGFWVDTSPVALASGGGGGGGSSYTDSDVDTHLNQSTALTGQVLTWNGSDYDWSDEIDIDGTGQFHNLGVSGIATVVSGLRITGGGLNVVGVSTFTSPVYIYDLYAGFYVTNDPVSYGTYINVGDDQIYAYDGITGGSFDIRSRSDENSYILNNTGIGTNNPNAKLDVNGTLKVSGIATFTAGVTITGTMAASGLLKESVNITAGTLSANPNIDLENGMVHLFTTAETTTSTPNIRYSASTSLDSAINIGEALSVTLITTAAAAGYATTITIDGANSGLNWTSGSAPVDGGTSGVDLYAFTIIKTGSAAFTVIGSQTKTS